MRQPILLLNPATDAEFVEFARDRAAAAQAPDDLERQLRRLYPSAVVRLRSIEGEQHTVWYVYRDGRWVLDPQSPGGLGDEGPDSR